MAKITQDQELVLTREEAYKLIKNADGRVRFQVKVQAWLPIKDEPNKGFDGITFISVSREQALQISQEVLGEILQARGGRLRVSLTAPKRERGLSFISIS